jgi:para-nitrobenzyl esterase
MAPLLAGCASSSPPTVRLDSGPISGFERSGVNAYLGIPFAAAPVGSLRWKAPQGVTPWTEVRECRVFGPDPAQPDVIAADGTVTKVKGSEDCLYLNVYVPNKAAPAGAPQCSPVSAFCVYDMYVWF